jgi:hypothetical protein
MSTIASLDVDLSVNSAKFIEGLRKARKEHEDFARSLSEFAERSNKMTESLGIKVDSNFSLGGVIEKAREAEESQAKLKAVLTATGEAAGINVEGMKRIEEELVRVTTFSHEAARGAETVLATFTNVRGDQFRETMKAAADLAVVFNIDLTTAARKVGRALENPEDGLKALAKMGVQFTASQKDVIKSLVETGQTAKAQEEILKAINAKVGGSAEAAAKTATGALHQIKNAYDELAATIGTVVLPVVSSAMTAINGIAAVSNAAAKAVKLLGEAEQFAAAAAAVLEAITSPAMIGVILAAGALGAATYELIESFKRESNETNAAAQAHEKAAGAARDQAEALELVAKSAKKAADEQHKLIEELVKEASGGGQSGLVQRLQDQADMLHQKIARDAASMNAGHGTKQERDEWQRMIGEFKDLQSAISLTKAKEAGEESVRNQAEQERKLASLRSSLEAPIDKLQATFKELANLVENKALSMTEARELAGHAIHDYQKANPLQQPVASAALNQGSVGAYSAALSNQRNNNAEDAAAKQLEAAKQQLQNVENFGQAVDSLRQQQNTVISIN